MNTARTLTSRACLVCCLLVATAAVAHAADGSCSPVIKAANAGLAQVRIHAAIDSPLDPEAVKMGFKPTLMHSIVIDQVQYSNAIHASFSRTPLESRELRLLATDLGPFMVEGGCRPLGSEKVAGRDAQVYLATGDLGRGEVRLKLWIDRASGLPLRAVTDEPDVDVETFLDDTGRKGRPTIEVRQAPSARRLVATHAYLYGDAVKPPGPKGALDPAALATLQAVLKGSP